MKPTTYPEMNEKIKGLLRMDETDHVDMYAAQRIEELEQELERLQQAEHVQAYWAREGLIAKLESELEQIKKIEAHGKWTKESVWIYRNDKNQIMRAQDEHPSQGVKDADRILEVSRSK